MPPKKRCRHDAETFSKAFRTGDVEAHEAEIDRRVAEERAKLLEQLLSLPPSIYDGPTRYISFDQVLAQFEKENP